MTVAVNIAATDIPPVLHRALHVAVSLLVMGKISSLGCAAVCVFSVPPRNTAAKLDSALACVGLTF